MKLYMSRKCPPGVICIENITAIFLVSIISVVIAYYFYILKINKVKNTPIVEREMVVSMPPPPFPPRIFSPPVNVLTNPYTPPLKDGGWFPTGVGFNGGVPINIKTRGFDNSYRQTGILTRSNGRETILPLMGRPLHINRNKWQFYTISDNNIKLPISRNGKSCTSEYGCDNLYNGDSVYIEGYNDTFNVTIYDNYEPRYIPYL